MYFGIWWWWWSWWWWWWWWWYNPSSSYTSQKLYMLYQHNFVHTGCVYMMLLYMMAWNNNEKKKKKDQKIAWETARCELVVVCVWVLLSVLVQVCIITICIIVCVVRALISWQVLLTTLTFVPPSMGNTNYLWSTPHYLKLDFTVLCVSN